MTDKSSHNRSLTRFETEAHEIRGMFTDAQRQSQRPFLLWDVSNHGLGIWSDTAVGPRAKLILTIGQPFLMVIAAEVKWCEKQPNNQGFRIGLNITAGQDRLHLSLSKAFNNLSLPQPTTAKQPPTAS